MFCYKYKRFHINRMIKEMATQYGVAFKDAYNTFYVEFTKQSGTDIHILYRTQNGLSKMDTLELMEADHGFLTQFYNIIKNEYTRNKQSD